AAWSLAVFVAFGVCPAVNADEVVLKWKAADAGNALGGFSPQRLTLSDEKPAAIKKLPRDLRHPRYGEIKIGPKEAPGTFLVVLDEIEGASSRLYVDSNANGDLTDDARPAWAEQTTPGTANDIVTCNGEAAVRIPYPAGNREARLKFY